ncbi:MAG: DUF2479 domain-containing protein [Desulfobacteraceae bacterium]|nr:MAG: DUF2479 domain-containing protein [Desulfobacteraceae bacterium]
MPRTIIDAIKNDKLYELSFALKKYDDEVIDLDGATLKLKVQAPGSTVLKFEGIMSIVDADAGTCKYLVADGNFDEAGNYHAEIEVTYSTGQVITFSDIIIKVKSDLPK